MREMLIDVGIILILLVVNGVFAMTEIAVVSARKARLRRLAAEGDARATVALELAESPKRFLSTVQIGITLVGILAGAFRAGRRDGRQLRVRGTAATVYDETRGLRLRLPQRGFADEDF